MIVEAIKPRLSEKLAHTSSLVNNILNRQTHWNSKLNAQQINLLISLRIDRKMTLTEVSEHTGLLGNQRSALILPLYEQGLITTHLFRHEPGIMLTQKGEEILRSFFPNIESCEKQIYLGFNQEEKVQFLNFLERIQANCKNL